MPRALKLPPTCRCSSLSQTSPHSTPSDWPDKRISGVVRKKSGWVASGRRAAAMAARSIMRGAPGDKRGQCRSTPPGAQATRGYTTDCRGCGATADNMGSAAADPDTLCRPASRRCKHVLRFGPSGRCTGAALKTCRDISPVRRVQRPGVARTGSRLRRYSGRNPTTPVRTSCAGHQPAGPGCGSPPMPRPDKAPRRPGNHCLACAM